MTPAIEIGLQVKNFPDSFIEDKLIEGSDGNDLLCGWQGNNHIIGKGGDDELYGYLGNDYIEGGLGNDYIDGGLGINLMEGEEGDDYIIGGDEIDIISGGPGNDLLMGQRGNDLYYFFNDVKGYGQDKIFDNDIAPGNRDTLILDGFEKNRLQIRQINQNLEISQIDSTDTITIARWFCGEQYQIEDVFCCNNQGCQKIDMDSAVEQLLDKMATLSSGTDSSSISPVYHSLQMAPIITTNFW